MEQLLSGTSGFLTGSHVLVMLGITTVPSSFWWEPAQETNTLQCCGTQRDPWSNNQDVIMSETFVYFCALSHRGCVEYSNGSSMRIAVAIVIVTAVVVTAVVVSSSSSHGTGAGGRAGSSSSVRGDITVGVVSVVKP